MKLFCNNKSAISIAYNLFQHDMTKLIKIDRHFIKEQIDIGLITKSYINHVEYVFMKGLLKEQFNQLTYKLVMIDIHSPSQKRVS